MAAIMLTQDDIDTEFPSLRFDLDGSGFVDNTEAAEATFNPDDTGADMADFGRITGYGHLFTDPQAPFGGSDGDPVIVSTEIHVLRDENSAAEFLVMLATEPLQFEGVNVEGVTLRSVTPVVPGVALGEEIRGYQGELVVFPASFSIYAVHWRRGSVVLGVGYAYVGAAGSDPGAAVQRLAVRMDDRVGPALAGEIAAVPLPVATEEPEPVPPTPTPRTTPSGEDVRSFASVSAGYGHSCGVKTDGSVVCWGSGFDDIGQASPLGGSFASVSAGWETCGVKTDGSVACWGSGFDDVLLGDFSPPKGSFTSVSTGSGHACGVQTDGSLVCWGGDWHGESTPPSGIFTSVSAGDDHSCGVKTDGSVVCWGDESYGPATPPAGAFTSISAGTYHTCGVRTDGAVVCWGADGAGQATPPEGSFTSVSAGHLHTCGVRDDGTLACWGSNEVFDFTGQATPPDGSFASVSAGSSHSCGVMTDGSVVCWGSDEDGKATAPGQSLPTPYTARSGADVGPFSSVSAGSSHSCGVRMDGSAICWGSNEGWVFRIAGQATPPSGIFASVSAGAYHTCGVRTDRFVECWGDDRLGSATPIGLPFSSVSAGLLHTCGVTVDDSVECWGSNEDTGGDFVGQATPPAGSFTSVSAGALHTCGLRTDGSVVCWGWNAVGQATPPAGSFKSVSAGVSHSCGVRTDGSVECWGYDYDGQASPPEGTFTSVSAGAEHSCGVKTDGSIACWGNNRSLGDFIGQATPPKGSFTSVSAGNLHTCAVEVGGAVVCWGSNEDGQATPPDTAPVAQVVDDDHGNSGWGATPVMVGDTVQGEIEHGADVDFFAFDVEEGKFYQIDVALGTLSDSVANLYDSDVRWLAFNDDLVDSQASRIIWKAPGTQRHHVSVTGAYSDDVGSYTLTVAAYDGADDYGDSAGEAASIVTNEGVRGALDYNGDADFFTFEAEEGKLYQIDVALETLSDSVATLYDADERELASNDDQGDSWSSRIHWKAPASGRYYVGVTGYGLGSYTLTISGIVDDHGDSREKATSITVGRVLQGVLQFEGDEDHFGFQVEEGKSYWVDVYLVTLPDVTAIVTDEEGGLEAFHSGGVGFSREMEISVSADTSGRYYISIAGQTGSYTVTVSDASLDRAALVALYDATDGPDWENNTNWLSDEPLDEWYGVTTDFKNKRVTHLDLQDNKLSGELSPELGSLFNLKGLYLNQNALTGEIPIELARLSKLTELALWGNQLSGEIPLELGNLSNLVGLALGLNRLTGEIPAELGNLAKLTALGLQGNKLTGEVPAELGSLSNLRELSLSGNRLTGCVPASLEVHLSLSDLGDLSFC